jgi:hypothetical protein
MTRTVPKYGWGFSSSDEQKFDELAMILGQRYRITSTVSTMKRHGIHLEVVEGDRETVYQMDADSVDDACGKLLAMVLKDMAKRDTSVPPKRRVPYDLGLQGVATTSGEYVLLSDEFDRLIREGMWSTNEMRKAIEDAL